MYNSNHYLVHYGIKGMKWGIRRYQNADGSLTSAGKARYAADRSQNLVSTQKEKLPKGTIVDGYQPGRKLPGTIGDGYDSEGHKTISDRVHERLEKKQAQAMNRELGKLRDRLHQSSGRQNLVSTQADKTISDRVNERFEKRVRQNTKRELEKLREKLYQPSGKRLKKKCDTLLKNEKAKKVKKMAKQIESGRKYLENFPDLVPDVDRKTGRI